MEQALKPDVLMQIVRGFSVYIQVAKIKTALTWLHISLMNSSDYCIQANPCLAWAFVLCSDLEPVFSRTRWNTVSSQADTIGLLAMLTIFIAIKTENRFMILWINSQFSNSLRCLCHCLSLVSHVKHEANIFGHSADCHHNSLCLGRCSWLRVSLFVAPYVNTLPGDLWAIIKSCLQDACEEWLQRLCISLRFFHPSFHFTFFWAHQLWIETSNHTLSCGWDPFTIQTLTICLCLLLPSFPLLTATDLNALWDLTRKWNNMAATAAMDAIILLFSLPVCRFLPSASISENERTEWEKNG